MISMQNITAGYGGEPVLRELSLTFSPGKITALVGPNGCGKSTLFRVAARLLEPSGGTLLFEGRPAACIPRKEFARLVAVLPQVRNIPSLSVRSMVLHGRFPYLGYPRRYTPADRAAVERAMELTGVADLAEKNLAALSGGERQKVYLAMAIAQETPVLLLDEPTTYLDIGHQLELMRLVRSLQQAGRTVVMVLHDLNLALQAADELVVLQQGRVLRQGSAQQIYESRILEAVFDVRIDQTADAAGRTQYLMRLQR